MEIIKPTIFRIVNMNQETFLVYLSYMLSEDITFLTRYNEDKKGINDTIKNDFLLLKKHKINVIVYDKPINEVLENIKTDLIVILNTNQYSIEDILAHNEKRKIIFWSDDSIFNLRILNRSMDLCFDIYEAEKDTKTNAINITNVTKIHKQFRYNYQQLYRTFSIKKTILE